MTPEEQVGYAMHVLQNNTFYGFEIDSYMGKSKRRSPHGLHRNIWAEAAKRCRFRPDNLEELEGKFYLKE